MRLYIPSHLSFGCCPGSIEPPRLCGAFFVKGTLNLRPGAPAAWAEEPDLVSGDVYVDGDAAKALRYPSDFVVFKPRADLLLVGHAHAPGGQPAPSFEARFSVGQFSKTLTVAGERTWQSSLIRGTSFSSPQPFTSWPLSYEFAYGGSGFARNPIGRGHAGDPAPNLVDPKRVDAREPAGFGPIPPSWPQRSNLVGTYRGNYVKERWPWFPSDFDWGYFNAAPRDQQLDTHLRGDEDITLECLHPEHPVFRSALPGVRVRCFLDDRAENRESRFREVPLNLDTLWIDADEMKMVLVWRGNAEVRTPKMRELERVLVVAESLSESPRSVAYYRESLERERPTAAVPANPLTPEHIEREKRFAELDQQMAEMDQKFAAFEKDLAAHEAAAEKQIAAAFKDMSLEFAVPPSPPAPAVSAVPTAVAAALARLRQAAPDQAEQLAGIDVNEFVDADKEFRSLESEAAQMEQEMTPAKGWTRERVQSSAAARESLIEQDLAGLDLSGLDLSGRDLSRSRLKGAKLQSTNLKKANLSGADLSGSDLEGAILTGAKLDRADLTGALLTKAKLTSLSLNGTTLTRVDLAGADLTASVGKGANFAQANLEGTWFLGVNMPAADFSGCNLARAVFAQAELPGARFEACKAAGVDFSGADIQGIHADEGADFSAGKFKHANASKAVFDTSNLDNAVFTRSNLARAQMEGASLRGANFDRADLTGAMFDDACLQRAVLTRVQALRASFDRADLSDANLQDGNFFESGFWGAVTERWNSRNANLKSTLLS